MAAKEKINLLDVIPCRSEHITVEREGETIVLSFMCIWKNTERLYGN